jgi:hypothetical protein
VLVEPRFPRCRHGQQVSSAQQWLEHSSVNRVTNCLQAKQFFFMIALLRPRRQTNHGQLKQVPLLKGRAFDVVVSVLPLPWLAPLGTTIILSWWSEFEGSFASANKRESKKSEM